jgi:hypothetical protein
MSCSRFKDFCRFLPEFWFDFQLKDAGDPWCNDIQREGVQASSWKVIDELMCAWRPRTTALGGLPNISFIMRKPEPLGTQIIAMLFASFFLFNNLGTAFFSLGMEMKCMACPKTGCMLNLEIQRGKDGMKEMMYNNRIGATSGCTLRMMEDTVGEDTPFNGIIGDAWFGSTRTVSEVVKAGFEGIFQIKQYTALFPKKFIEETLEEAPGGVKIVLSGVHPNDEKLIALGYRYRYVNCFLVFKFIIL